MNPIDDDLYGWRPGALGRARHADRARIESRMRWAADTRNWTEYRRQLQLLHGSDRPARTASFWMGTFPIPGRLIAAVFGLVAATLILLANTDRPSVVAAYVLGLVALAAYLVRLRRRRAADERAMHAARLSAATAEAWRQTDHLSAEHELAFPLDDGTLRNHPLNPDGSTDA